MRRWWVLAPLALVAAGLCGAMGHAARFALNPDGVSYLDLAGHLRAGDWAHFIQGYWSPLYPVLLAAVEAISGRDGADLIPLVHALDLLLVVATIAVICRIAWRSRNPVFALAGIPLFLVASGRLPRVEALTPDLLLGFVFALIAAEVLLHGRTRWIRLGLLFGASYLTKTSNWPWLLAALAVALAGASGRDERRGILRIAAVCAAVMLCWIAPLSVVTGKPTLGSAGRLNYHWYIENADTRMPDTHTGGHLRYSALRVDSAMTVTIATFDPGVWSYQPWGDPTAWDAGLVGGYTVPIRLPVGLRAWNDFKYMVTLWTVSVTVTVLLPLFWMTFRRGMFRQLVRDDRPAALLMILSLTGIAQFIAVHAEPRLIAPYVLMGGLGAVFWLTHRPGDETGHSLSTSRLFFAVTLAWAWSLAMGINTVEREFGFQQDDQSRLEANLRNREQTAPYAGPHPDIILVGKAGPTMADIWRTGGRVMAQVIRPSAAQMDSWSPERKIALVNALAPLGADMIWVVLPDGTLAMMPGQ